jgi:hypothetical protein
MDIFLFMALFGYKKMEYKHFNKNCLKINVPFLKSLVALLLCEIEPLPKMEQPA